MVRITHKRRNQVSANFPKAMFPIDWKEITTTNTTQHDNDERSDYKLYRMETHTHSHIRIHTRAYTYICICLFLGKKKSPN